MRQCRNKVLMMWIMLAMSACSAAADESVSDLLKNASTGGSYMAPAIRELEQAEVLFQRCFIRCDDAAVVQGWNKLGFDVIKIEYGKRPLIVVREKERARRGRGFYVFRPQSTSIIALQAPHSFKDMRTRKIVLNLMGHGDFRAAAWNTVPRHYQDDGMIVNADVAHLQSTYFLIFSRAFAQQFSDGKLVQLHGFSQAKRHSSSGANADIVISSGRWVASDGVLEVGGCLQSEGFGHVRIYPVDVRELGATHNSNAKELNSMGHKGFIHIEMSALVRLELIHNMLARRKLLGCLKW